MKKLTLVLLLALVVCFALIGCKTLPTKDSSKTSQSASATDGSQVTSDETSDSHGETPATYTLTLGETAMTVTKGQAIGTLPEVPEKTGYTATGWAIGEDAITAETVWAYDEDKTATAKYTANEYALTLGEAQITVTYEQAIGELPEVPAMAGHTGAWYIGEEAITAQTVWTYTEDKAATAEYTANEYTLTLGETAMTVTYGQAVGTLPAVPAKDGHTATGWFIGETEITAETVWAYTEDKTATAGYTANHYTLTLGETAMTVTYGQAVGTLPAIPAQDGHTATGWFIGETEITAETVWAYTEDKTATAGYTANEYTLTLGETPMTVTYGQAIGELPAIPEYDAQKKYKGYWAIGETAIAADTVWAYTEDKTATAPYWNFYDMSADFIADFLFESDEDYAISAAGLAAADIEAVKHGNDALTYTVNGANNEIVFANDYIKAMPSGDYILDAYTASNVYRVKVAFITKVVRTVADLKAISAYGASHKNAHTGYYVLGNDIDGADQESINALSYDSTTPDNYMTNGFRGILDGRGHVLKNIKFKEGMLFWGLGNNAVVRNLALIDPVQEGARAYILARDVVHATISNVIIKANSAKAFLGTACGATISNCVFILETNGTDVIGQKDDTFADSAHAPTNVSNWAVVVKSNSGTLNALVGTYYKVNQVYAEYEAANGIHDYASFIAMITELASSDFIADWNSPYIDYNDYALYFNGEKVLQATVEITAPANEIYAGNTMTVTAENATFALTSSIDGVSIDADTGVLTVGSAVPADTEITVRATSKDNANVYGEVTITVVAEPVDLTANGTYDIELGTAHGIAAIEGDVIAVKTATGNKVTLATANVITADELNTAAGVKWSECMTINFYTENKAYSVNAAFITKIIRNISDLKAAADYCYNDRDKNPVYYILANDIDGTDQGKVSAFSYNSTTPTNYTTAGFRGVFDGRGHILKNVELKDNRMFWGIGNNGVVKNFALIDPVFTSTPCILARDLVHGTISNVVVKSSAGSAFIGTACGATIENCVFIFEPNGTYLMSSKDDLSNNAASSINNVAIVVNSNSGTLKAVADNFYKPEGATYAEYEAANGIHDYASSAAMLAALASENYIAGWNSPFITFADGKLSFGGEAIARLEVVVTGNNEIYANSSATLTASDATFALKEAIAGVSINATTGELTVGDVQVGTEIIVVATSTLAPSVSAEFTVTVVAEPVDLTANGVYDVELGSAHGIAAITDDILYIKTATGTKIELANANIVTASELNSAAGVKWSENMTITFYSASKAYSLNAAFITKIIRSIADLKSVSANKVSYETSYLVIGNDIDGTDQDSINTLSREISDSLYVSQGFRGVLDGRGHILSNIKLQEGMLFWGIGKNGVVKNLALIDPVQVTARGYCFARDLGNSTVSNVVVKASSTAAILITYKSAVISNSVFILESSGQFVFNTVGVWGDHQTTFSNLAIVVGNPTAGTLGNSAESYAGLIGTHYVQGSYATFKTNRNIYEYTTSSAMLTALGSSNYISSWSSPYISYADGALKFGGTTVIAAAA